MDQNLIIPNKVINVYVKLRLTSASQIRSDFSDLRFRKSEKQFWDFHTKTTNSF